jgi:hypothetical protein
MSYPQTVSYPVSASKAAAAKHAATIAKGWPSR